MISNVKDYRKQLISTIIDDLKEKGVTWPEIRSFLRDNYKEIKRTAIKSVKGINNFNMIASSFDNIIVVTKEVKQGKSTNKYFIAHHKTKGINAKSCPELITVNCKKGSEVKRLAKEIRLIGGMKNIVFGFDSNKLNGITGVDLNHIIGENHCRVDLSELGSLVELHRQNKITFSQTSFFTGDVLRNTALFNLCYNFIYYNENIDDYC